MSWKAAFSSKYMGYLLSTTLMLPAAAPLALAQAPGAETGVKSAAAIDEILVTTRRRSELLQRVPDQVTVFTGQEITDSRITSYQDFANLTPNLQSFENFRRGVFNISIRGIPTVQGGEPPVTILVDGVQVSGLDFVNQDLFDLDNIQVLRGPQGAVYGRGAIGGAILINTTPPSDTLEAKALGSWTSEIEEYRIQGSISGPLVEDKMAVRVSGSYADRRGFLTNSLAGGYCDFSEEKVVRGQVRLTPSESFTIDAKMNYLDGKNYASCLNFSFDDDPFLGNGKNFAKDLPRDFKQFDDRTIKEAVFKMDWNTGVGTLVSASSFQKSDSFSPGDVDFGPVIQPVFFENPVIVESWNTNWYLLSPEHENYSWIIGAFYQHRKTNNLLRVGFEPLPIQPPFLVNSDQFDLSKSWAVYGEGTYNPIPDVELAVSLRYDVDKRESEDRNAPGSFIEKKFTAFQPRGSISYFWSDNVTSYFSVGRGFRSGGFNSLADTVAVGLTDRLFDKETATNYELGFKSTLLDGRMSLNGALFRTDFKNQQFFFIDVVNVARIVLTLPKTRINGAELETIVRPVEALELRGALGIADGKIRRGGIFGMDGAPSPNAHRYTVNLSAQYDIAIANTLTLRPRAEYERRGPIYYDQFGDFRFPSTDFINASLTLESDHWAITGFVRNLTDERIPTFFGPNSGGPGIHQFLQNLPRRFGIELRANL